MALRVALRARRATAGLAMAGQTGILPGLALRALYRAATALMVAAVTAWGAWDIGTRAGRLAQRNDLITLGVTECHPDGAYVWIRSGLTRRGLEKVIEHEANHVRQCAAIGAGMWIWTTSSSYGSIDMEIQAFALTHLKLGDPAPACPWEVADAVFSAYPRAASVWPGWVMERAFAHCARPL